MGGDEAASPRLDLPPRTTTTGCKEKEKKFAAEAEKAE